MAVFMGVEEKITWPGGVGKSANVPMA